MRILQWAVATACLTWTASAAVRHDGPLVRPEILETREEDLLGLLMKRQNVSAGSPGYNCHDNCGQAIIEVRNCASVNICNDTTFTTNYDNCLQCAGPDNENIWMYYGPALNATASACGYATTPASGAQDGVGAAVAASNTTAACEAAVSSSSSSNGTTATGTGTASSATSTSASSGAGHLGTTQAFGNYAAAVTMIGALFALGLAM